MADQISQRTAPANLTPGTASDPVVATTSASPYVPLTTHANKVYAMLSSLTEYVVPKKVDTSKKQDDSSRGGQDSYPITPAKPAEKKDQSSSYPIVKPTSTSAPVSSVTGAASYYIGALYGWIMAPQPPPKPPAATVPSATATVAADEPVDMTYKDDSKKPTKLQPEKKDDGEYINLFELNGEELNKAMK